MKFDFAINSCLFTVWAQPVWRLCKQTAGYKNSQLLLETHGFTAPPQVSALVDQYARARDVPRPISKVPQFQGCFANSQLELAPKSLGDFFFIFTII